MDQVYYLAGYRLAVYTTLIMNVCVSNYRKWAPNSQPIKPLRLHQSQWIYTYSVCMLARPETGQVSRVGGDTTTRRRDMRETEEPAATRRRAPSAPESYTAEEYRSWATQRHQRSPSAPSRRRSIGPAASDRRRLTTATSRRPADGEQRAPARTPAVARPGATATSARRPVAAGSSGLAHRDFTLTKKPLKIRTEDFRPYRTSPRLLRQQQLRRRRGADDVERRGLDGMLSVHVYCGHGLRATPTSLRDLYCVIGVDGLNRARTAVQKGAINFDWDEKFDIDVLDAESVSFGVYSWATGATSTTKQRLFFSGTVHLREFLQRGGPHQQLALRLDPTGVLYVELEYLDVSYVYRRSPAPLSTGRFGVTLESLVLRERAPGNVPVVVRRCAEEVERRGLECVGIYRLCCSSRRRRILKADIEADAETAVLSADRVPDVNVVSCKSLSSLV